MRIVLRLPQVLVGIGVIALGAVGLAAIAQYVFNMQPCPWCVLQRLIYIVVGVLALVAAALPGLGRRLFIALALLGTLCGLASALWLRAMNSTRCWSRPSSGGRAGSIRKRSAMPANGA